MQDADALPLYNSRITQTYVDYLRVAHPNVSVDKVLKKSGITNLEVADRGHWFNQKQVDRLHDVLVAETGDQNIARNAGRFIASARSISGIRHYLLGLVSVENVYLSMAKLMPLVTRGVTVSVKKHCSGKIEIVSTPNPGVQEKPYQCENRLGSLEALSKPFTSQYAHIEHPHCYHQGDPGCHYIVTWKSSVSHRLRLLRNYFLLASAFLSMILCFILSGKAFTFAVVLLAGINLLLSLASMRQKLNEQARIIETQHQWTQEQMDAANTNYNNALLAQEIGQATVAVLDIDRMIRQLAKLMNNRLAFDRGLILLADKAGRYLCYSAGYGWTEKERRRLGASRFYLDQPGPGDILVKAFMAQEPVIADNIENLASGRRDRAKNMRARSMLCVPIIYGQKAMGVLAVDNVRSKIAFKKSDVHLLQGIAAYIAISLSNAASFRQLHASETKYRQTIESIAEGFFEIDMAYKIVFVNKSFCEMLGYTHAELIGSRFDHHFGQGAEYPIERLLTDIQHSKAPVYFTPFEMVRRKGESIAIDLSASLILNAENQVLGFRGLIRDATERLGLEKEKKQLQTRLLQVQKMEAIGTLAGGIAHNFNNWLGGILGNVTLIRMDPRQSEESIARAKKIENIVESASAMTQQLLGYARGGKYKVAVIDINKIIRAAAEAFSATRKDVSIRLNLQPGLDAIRADGNQIEQILWNLYVNAADAMPAGGKLYLESRHAAGEDLSGRAFKIIPRKYICFSISDSGVGIDQDHLNNIFDPFFTTKEGTGTGLGLASVYGIVKAHKGYIDVSSVKGKGTRFDIFFPAADQGTPVTEETDNHIIQGSETILLVDDEAAIVDATGQLLGRYGYQVLTAESGAEALKIYTDRNGGVDLVIIDMIMPEMNGSQLFEQFKKINPNIKTLLSSGYSLNSQVQRLIDLGCDGFIQKPFDLSKLTAKIKEILNADRPCQ